MSESSSWFLLEVEVQNNIDNQGVDVEGYINNCLSLIHERAVFKFRVVGEPKLVTVLETKDPAEVTKLSSSLMGFGPICVKCTTLLPYEEWAKCLGVEESLIVPNPRKLSTPIVYMVEVEVELHGMTTDEFISVCKEEAIHMLTGRSKGLELVLFSLIGARKVVGFNLGRNPLEMQNLLLGVPLVKKMFNNVHFKVRTLSNL